MSREITRQMINDAMRDATQNLEDTMRLRSITTGKAAVAIWERCIVTFHGRDTLDAIVKRKKK